MNKSRRETQIRLLAVQTVRGKANAIWRDFFFIIGGGQGASSAAAAESGTWWLRGPAPTLSVLLKQRYCSHADLGCQRGKVCGERQRVCARSTDLTGKEGGKFEVWVWYRAVKTKGNINQKTRIMRSSQLTSHQGLQKQKAQHEQKLSADKPDLAVP